MLRTRANQNACNSPRKEKNIKPPTGGNVVPHEQTIKVNPNRGKQGQNPQEGISGGHQMELVPRRPQENSNENLSGSNSMAPAKAKINPRKGISFEFHAQARSVRAPKGNTFIGA